MAPFKWEIVILLIAGLVVVEASAGQEMTVTQLHRYYDDGYERRGGMSRFGALIVGVVCGVLCFFAVLYYFKKRREGGPNFSFWDLIPGRGNNPQTQPHPAYPQPHQPHYVNSPHPGY